MARCWSRDCQREIDQIAESDDGIYLLDSFKESAHSAVGTDVLLEIRSQIDVLPKTSWNQNPRFALYAEGGLTGNLGQ